MDRSNNLSFHEALRLITEEYGIQVLGERRLAGIVADILGGAFKFYPVVYRSIQTRVGDRILALIGSKDSSMVIPTLKQTFQEENFLNPNAASYLIESYAYAAGLIPEVTETLRDYEERLKGEPLFIETDDGEYCGYINSEAERCGFGILKEPTGGYYAGEWKLNMRMGVGIGVSATRKKYIGQWRINKQHGIGTELQEDGTIYSGQWRNGKRQGLGTLFFPNGECLTAFFVNDEMSDTVGIFYLQDNTFVQGHMTENGPDGLCFHTLIDGTIIEEYWNNGRRIENY